MTILEDIAKKGNEAVRRLRLQKLRNGEPFMINSQYLEPYCCYLEFPNGTIQLACLKKGARELTPIRILSITEEEVVRTKFNLPRIEL